MKGFRYIALAAAVAALAACTVHQADPPSLTGPSGPATSITVAASPQTLQQGSTSPATITAKVIATDQNGQTNPKANMPIRFDMQVGGVTQDFGTLSSRTATTGSDGSVSVQYLAPAPPVGGNTGTCNGLPGTCVTIVASLASTTSISETFTLTPASTTILLTPPGVILPPAGTPTASFNFSPTAPVANAPVLFDASASTPGSGASQITTYSWSFGDGATGTGKTVSHTYATLGTYQATLTVTNDRGVAASTTQNIAIATAFVPTAKIAFSPSTPQVGQLVFFDATQSVPGTGHTITGYSWVFGDGGTGTGATTTHPYNAIGTYTITLTITDEAGQTNTAATTIPVGSPSGTNTGQPFASFTYSPTSPIPDGIVVTFDASASKAATGATIVSYQWAWGDGTPTVVTTQPTFGHAFNSSNSTFTVTLTVTDSKGQQASTSQQVRVF